MRKNPVLLLSLIILLPLSGCAALKQGPEDTAIRIKGKKEILIAEDISRGDMLYRPKWCGDDALLFRVGDIGIVLIDFATKKRIIVSTDPDDWPVNCTPDGEWVVYKKQIFIPNPTYDEYDGPDENPYQSKIPVQEVYRYEVATGNRQRFAATGGMGSSTAWVSPDGKKISLRPWYRSVKPEGGPWLDAVWFSSKKWNPGEYAWFQDSSGMAAYLGGPDDIGVEFFGDGGWTGAFELWGPGIGVSSLKVDRENRIYITRTQGAVDMETGIVPLLTGKNLLLRCSVESRQLVCEEILARGNLGPYEILPDGDILFELIYGKCIRRASPGGTDDECVLDSDHAGGTYNDIGLIGVSPDGKRLAFMRFKGRIMKDDPFRYDLFLINITGD
jgi:hypothetical protein